jgi:hypothetical protein
MGVIDFSITGPTESSKSSSVARRVSNSSQIRSSGQSASESPRVTDRCAGLMA